MKQQENEIAKNLEVFNTYLKENEKFNIEAVKRETEQSSEIQRQNLRHFLKLGKLISEGLNEFNSPEAKQQRKNLGLKISVEYFIEQAYGYKKRQAYNLKECYELPNEVKEAYLNSGILENELSMRGLLKFANPKKETETAETETAETETAETETATNEDSQQTSFGGITLTLNKATKKDIEEAIAYLNNLVK